MSEIETFQSLPADEKLIARLLAINLFELPAAESSRVVRYAASRTLDVRESITKTWVMDRRLKLYRSGLLTHLDTTQEELSFPITLDAISDEYGTILLRACQRVNRHGVGWRSGMGWIPSGMMFECLDRVRIATLVNDPSAATSARREYAEELRKVRSPYP